MVKKVLTKGKGGKASHATPIKMGKPFSKRNKKKVHVKKDYTNTDITSIANKQKRNDILFKKKRQLKMLKSTQRKERQEKQKQTGEAPAQPVTTDDKRELDDNFIFSEDEELINEEKFDEFSSYFQSDTPAKILLTTSIRPNKKTFDFLKEMQTTLPHCYYWPRKDYPLKEISEYAQTKNYTDICVFRENRKKIDELILIHLPNGPTAIFKLTNLKLNKEIFHHGKPSDHHPEIVLSNFNTNIGRRIARFFTALFPQQPEYKGRRVVTFYNARDFVFFRHHRYIFNDAGSKVNMQEIGPRFTLQLKVLQKGVFDNMYGEIEFKRTDDMYVSRKKFNL